MDMNTRTVGGVTVIDLTGDLDAAAAQKAEGPLLAQAAAAPRLLLDLTHVPRISSAGLRLLLLVYRRIAGHGGRLALAGLSDDAKDMMSAAGYLDNIGVYDSVEPGLAALAR
ncbi:MAG: anti-sigma factor antagonist [Rudaea sp.]